MADFSILTEDNNRFEKVEDILADIRVGMNKGNPDAKFVEIPDRLDALHYAVDHAQEGDLIAVIGKGHETYRDREGVKTPFLEMLADAPMGVPLPPSVAPVDRPK